MKICETCGKPLETDKPYKLGLTSQEWVPCLCDCQKGELDAAEAEEREAAKERRRVECIFPSLAYGDMVFERAARSDCLVKAWRFSKGFESIRPTGCGLLLKGSRGGGKTFAAACIANELSRQGYSVRFVSVPELCKTGRDWGDDPTEGIKGLDLLVLDDMGAERSTEYAQEQLFRAVDAAYAAKVPMIVTTNCEEVEGRAWSRVAAVCALVEVEGVQRDGSGLGVVREVIGV